MPTITVDKAALFEALGQEWVYTRAQVMSSSDH